MNVRLVNKVGMYFIGNKQYIVLLAYLTNSEYVRLRPYTAHWIVGAAEDHHLSIFGFGFQIIKIHLVTVIVIKQFVVDNVAKTEAQNTEAEKVRQQAVIESVANQAAVMAIQKKAEVEDLRGKYF